MVFFLVWSRENKKALNQTFWKRPKCWKVIDSPLLNTPAQNRGKLHTESNWCTKSKMSDRRSKHELPLSYHILHTDSYRLHCEPSMNLTACCCWQPNESSTRQNKWSDLGLHFLPRIGRWFVWITSLPCDSSPPPQSFYDALHKGYKKTSLSSRSPEEMRWRCMVRVMFSKWPFPFTHPFASAKENERTRARVRRRRCKEEEVYKNTRHPLR